VDQTAGTSQFFNNRQKKNFKLLNISQQVDFTLHRAVRDREMNRILNENEAMLKRLQNR